MAGFRRITKRDKPEALDAAETEYGALLTRALELAKRRAVRSSVVLRKLFESAVVEGRSPSSDIKAAVITFSAPLFRGGLHYIYPWEYLAAVQHKELATELSWMLRSALAEKQRTTRPRA